MRRGDPPERPAPSDCCNSGCSPCVTDLYEEALRRYELGLDDADGDAAQVALDPLSYREFTVTSVEWFPLTSAPTLRLSFSLPASCPRLGLAAGQHLWLRSRALGDDSADEVVSRPYTPITPPGVSPIGLYISLRDGGPMHRYLLHVSAGDTVSLRGPGGGFSLRTNRWHSITMIAGGTGIAPMLQVARAILANDRDDTSIKVIWSVRTFADAEPLGALLQSLTEYVTFKICFVVTRVRIFFVSFFVLTALLA